MQHGETPALCGNSANGNKTTDRGAVASREHRLQHRAKRLDPDSPTALAPLPGEPVVTSGPDKFFHTDLATILKAKNIQTVIVTGTIAPGAVLYTASAAALRGFAVVVPVDTMSANDAFSELSTAWVLAHAAVSVSSRVTLTRSDTINY